MGSDTFLTPPRPQTEPYPNVMLRRDGIWSEVTGKKYTMMRERRDTFFPRAIFCTHFMHLKMSALLYFRFILNRKQASVTDFYAMKNELNWQERKIAL